MPSDLLRPDDDLGLDRQLLDGPAHGLAGQGLGHAGQLDNYSRLGQLRKDIARIETLLRENEIAAAEAAEAEADAEWQAANEARRARVAASRKNEGEING